MKQSKVIGLIVVLMSFFCFNQSFAGDTYYKNLSFTVKNPETAKGRVYLTPHNSSDTTYCRISKDPKIAKVEGNLSNFGEGFKVDMFVIPSEGYVLDCLTTPNAFVNGNYRSECIGNTQGYPISSTILTIDQDTTTNCTKSRPNKDSYMQPVSTQELYAIFVPAKKMTVRNISAGSVANTIKNSKYGESTNDLVVTGPLNENDIKYLNRLSQEKGLIRLDLSGATFKVVPDSAFYNSGLYELKLPSNIEAIGNYAFANSMGLKPVNLPSGHRKNPARIYNAFHMTIQVMVRGGMKPESLHHRSGRLGFSASTAIYQPVDFYRGKRLKSRKELRYRSIL